MPLRGLTSDFTLAQLLNFCLGISSLLFLLPYAFGQ
jgi:hypothetical protein